MLVGCVRFDECDMGGGQVSYEKVVIRDCTLFRGDCLEIIPLLDNVDFVVTDPPYGINGGTGGRSIARGKGNYINTVDTPDSIKSVCVPVVKMCMGIAERLAMTPGQTCMFEYPRPDCMGCFYYPAGCGMTAWGFNCYQPIFFYGKSPNAGTMGHSNARRSTEGSDSRINHPCPKPIGDWTWLTQITSKPDECGLDPFMGSGTTGVACIKLSRRFIGIEIIPEYFDIACRRIERAYADQALLDLMPEPAIENQPSFLEAT